MQKWPWQCSQFVVSCTDTTKWAGCTDTSTEMQSIGGKMEDIPEYRRPDGKRGVPVKASSVNNFPHGTSSWALRQLQIDDCRHALPKKCCSAHLPTNIFLPRTSYDQLSVSCHVLCRYCMLIMSADEKPGKILATTKKFDKVILSSYPCFQTPENSLLQYSKGERAA